MSNKENLENALNKAMTLQDFIYVLQELSDGGLGQSRIVVLTPSHDHWGTVIAKPITKNSEIDINHVKWSGYHDELVTDSDEGENQVLAITLR